MKSVGTSKKKIKFLLVDIAFLSSVLLTSFYLMETVLKIKTWFFLLPCLLFFAFSTALFARYRNQISSVFSDIFTRFFILVISNGLCALLLLFNNFLFSFSEPISDGFLIFGCLFLVEVALFFFPFLKRRRE